MAKWSFWQNSVGGLRENHSCPPVKPESGKSFAPATQAVVTSAKRAGDGEKNTNEQIRGRVEEPVVLTSLIFFVWKTRVDE